MSDPICGNCGNPLSEHFVETYGSETRMYCYTHTTGDIFTDEPQDSAILSMLVERRPEIYDELVVTWKTENGHDPASQ